jgi:hypothetical protein
MDTPLEDINRELYRDEISTSRDNIHNDKGSSHDFINMRYSQLCIICIMQL